VSAASALRRSSPTTTEAGLRPATRILSRLVLVGTRNGKRGVARRRNFLKITVLHLDGGLQGEWVGVSNNTSTNPLLVQGVEALVARAGGYEVVAAAAKAAAVSRGRRLVEVRIQVGWAVLDGMACKMKNVRR
jgi:hypothetical protein